VLILAVTPAKRYHLESIQCRQRVKSSTLEPLDLWNVELGPLSLLKIESPHIIEIDTLSLTTADNHELANKTSGMIGPRQRNL
jgi:hypothetical protein